MSSIRPGPQPVATQTTRPWCCTCCDNVDPAKPHDLARDCMPVWDRRALQVTQMRDAVGAVVLQQMRNEAKPEFSGRPPREMPKGVADSAALRGAKP